MPTQEKTNPKLLVSYSFGEIACQMSWYMINTYLMASLRSLPARSP